MKKYGFAIIAAILCIILVASLAIVFYPGVKGMRLPEKEKLVADSDGSGDSGDTDKVGK